MELTNPSPSPQLTLCIHWCIIMDGEVELPHIGKFLKLATMRIAADTMPACRLPASWYVCYCDLPQTCGIISSTRIQE